MKKLMVLIFLISTMNAFAGEIKVAHLGSYQMWGTHSVTPQFAINKDLARAWVEFYINNNEEAASVTKVKVPGLTYDPHSKAIVIEHQGQLVECALLVIKGKGVFMREVLELTGRCEFITKWKTYSYDDGFEIKVMKIYQISLLID
jgi:hypothetical protein